ncbi:protein kinase family protein [Actinokineospora sp. G85]|uniref:protein kinase family protein n=1 Tax=Actinokineospora sp. G85 TaxID=3406626 RepID=UPI003C73DD4B
MGDGRYRLLAQFGVDERAAAQLWRAQDGQLRRDVALTLLMGDPGDHAAATAARRTLERATHTARITHHGQARILDVLGPGNGIGRDEGLLGIVVADWAQGTDLVDVIAEHPLPPATAARLLEPLAVAVESAHHQGLVLGVDHPQRVRVSAEGTLKLAFPGPLPQATLFDDVRGLGAILYLLLTSRWPLPNPPAGVARAPIGPDGRVVAPRAMYGYVPHDLSAAAVRSLDDSPGGIRTAAGLIRVLERAKSVPDVTQTIAAVDDEEEDYPDDDGAVWTTRRPSNNRAKRRKLAIGVTALAVATVGVLAWLGTQLIGFFGSDGTAAGGPVAIAPPPGGGAPSAPAQPTPTTPIDAADVKVFNTKGTPDNPKRVNRAVDGDPATGWRTDKYQDQFPTLKPGVGIMASFAEAVPFSEVTIDSPTPGTVVEIRSASSEKPELDETKVIGKATLQAGQNKLQLDAAEPTQHLLVWITTLGEGNVSELVEIVFTRTG